MSSERFRRLLKIREAQENEAAAALAARLGELSQIDQQRTQLLDYQRTYLNAMIPSDARMLKRLGDMQQYLREALQQQALRSEAARVQVERARAQWRERHQASLSMEKLIERREMQDATQEARRQQNELDAWATRRAFERETG